MSPAKSEQDGGRDRARHHGRLVLPQSGHGRLAGDRLRHRRRQAQGIGQGRRRDRGQRQGGRRGRADHHHQPAEARGADRDREGNRRGRPAAPHHRRMLDLHDRGQGEGREDPARRRPRHARLPGERHRLAGPDRRPRDLRQRRSQVGRQGQADVRRLLAQDVRRRRVRQRQPDEIRRQPPGRDQQCGLGRGHGARHEGRPRSEHRSSR